jgi:lipopolysaccharide transport system ATP-binding protein
MSDVVIKVENLSKQYNLGELHHQTNSFRDKVTSFFKKDGSPKKAEILWALKDVSFEVKRGEILGIIGRNGAGKSTLLKILSRITKPTSGKALINGRVGNLLEVGTGFHPELTGRENIYLNSAILGMKRAEISKKFDEIVAFAEIEKFIDTPVKRYSSGMYVRLAFAVAAHLEPEILLVDEVLAVGDAAFQKKCLGKIGDISGEGRTVLFVSHNMAAVRSLCPMSMYIESGRIACFDSSERAIDCYVKGKTVNGHVKRKGYSIDEKALAGCRLEGFEINNVEIHNLSRPDLPVASGDDIRVLIHYRASTKFISPVFAVNFNDQNGIEIFRTSNMPISGYPIDKLFNEGFVNLEIRRIPLVKGTYYIHIGFAREAVEWYFYAENLMKLEVEGKDIYHSGLELDRSRGMIWVDHSWHHEEL